jgi:hypothetical protein
MTTNNDNSWNSIKEKQLNEWINACRYYINEYEKERLFLKKKTNNLLILNILLSSMATIFNSVAISEKYYFNLIVISAVFTAISTGLGIYIKTVNLDKRLSKIVECIKGFKEIILQIQQELSIDINERTNGNEFIKKIALEMLNLENDSENGFVYTASNKQQSIVSKTMAIPKENDDIEATDNDDVKINGLTKDENNKFELFFIKTPSMKQDIINFQMERMEL